MPGFFSRLLGRSNEAPEPRRSKEAPSGAQSLRARIEAVQRRYWAPDPDALAALTSLSREELSWRDALRLHHLWCLDFIARRKLADGHAQLIEHLCAPMSPYRPRHAFVWEGDGPPAGEDIPYSTHQGKLANAALSHLASIEVVRLDAQLQPEALDFIAFDDLMTLAATVTQDARGARLLLEYGRGECVVLLADDYAPVESLDEPYALTSELSHLKLPAPLSPTQLVGAGRQRLRRLSDFAAEGLAEFALRDSYQVSLAIEAEDPRFEQKCRGRELDPQQMRADLAREQEGKRKQPGKKLRLRTL